MRLGAQECLIEENTLAYSCYKQSKILERHRHRYEFNNEFIELFIKSGLKISGKSIDGLVEMVEIDNHPWFLGCQFHPEFTSNPRDAHPLFVSYVKKIIELKHERIKN